MIRILLIIVAFVPVVYVLIPSTGFPTPPPGALQSHLPSDKESFYRRSYFTDYSRAEIMNHYRSQFGPKFFQIRLNHPPEFAYTYIRDQASSSYLEEIVHPFRESIYINGYEPTEPSKRIFVSSRQYKNKITVRYVPSTTISRLTSLSLVYLLIYYLFFKKHDLLK